MNEIQSIIYYDDKNLKVTIEFTKFQSKEEQIEFINNLNSLLGLFSTMPGQNPLSKTVH
jgi:prenyltransferase beta subunit